MGSSVVELEPICLCSGDQPADVLLPAQQGLEFGLQVLKVGPRARGGKHASFRVQLQAGSECLVEVGSNSLPEIAIGLMPCGRDRCVGGKFAAVEGQRVCAANVEDLSVPGMPGRYRVNVLTCRRSIAPMLKRGQA
jgi:hypothetical protein